MHPFAVLIEQMPIMKYKKETGFHIELWTTLNDTPYTNGQVNFAGWSSAEDYKKGEECPSGENKTEAEYLMQLIKL